jgi:hypothetical protein
MWQRSRTLAAARGVFAVASASGIRKQAPFSWWVISSRVKMQGKIGARKTTDNQINLDVCMDTSKGRGG